MANVRVEYSDIVKGKDPKKRFVCDFCKQPIEFSINGNYEYVVITCLNCSKAIKICKKEVEELS